MLVSTEAISKLDQILDEERNTPTVRYESTDDLLGKIANTSLVIERSSHPRKVHEDPRTLRFKSVNYDLLAALFSQIDDRQHALLHVLKRINSVNSCRKVKYAHFPNWDLFISELPLVAEFAIRAGYKVELFRALETAKPAPGLITLLYQLEEIIAVNWQVMTPDELEHIPVALSGLREKAREQSRMYRETIHFNGQSVPLSTLGRETEHACDYIGEVCRKAQYLFLKGELLSDFNSEINQDKGAIESYLDRLKFRPVLIESLNHAEDLYRSTSPFDLKSSAGHLRSFIENLVVDASQRIATKCSLTPVVKWGPSVAFLRDRAVLTKQEESLFTSLYTLISDESVHPLIAEREYARLSRNMVIECGLLLLTKLDKLHL